MKIFILFDNYIWRTYIKYIIFIFIKERLALILINLLAKCEFLNNVCPCTIKICINDHIKNINKKIEISKYNDSPNSLIKDIYRNENDITILIDINEKCQCKTSFKEFLKMLKLNLYQENKEKDIKTLNEFKESGIPIQMEQKN